MPIYEYECKTCGEHVEKMQKFSDPLLKECPHCGGELQKLMSLTSFQLKGSGWYVTDYKGKNPSLTNGDGNGNGNGNGNGSHDEKTATATTETKTEKATEPAKTEAKPSTGNTSTGT